jgi:uncharacterized protein YdaL
MFVLADVFHEFFNTGIIEQKFALVRFEDLAPVVCNKEILWDRLNELNKRNVPFSMGVVSVFKDPEGIYYPAGTEFNFTDDPEFVEVLNAMIDSGGTMLMHGATHQWNNGISRQAWEFSMGLDNEPVPDDSREYAEGKVHLALSKMGEQGWRPIIWETPHYSASHGDYHVINEHFNAYYEKPLVFPLLPGADPIFLKETGPTSQLIPYYTPVTALGFKLVPENLGMIYTADPNYASESYPEALLEIADRMRIIRDYVPSFFFHHDMVSEEELFTVIDGLIERGYTFKPPSFFTGEEGMPDPEDNDIDDSGDDEEDDDEGGCGC